MANFDVGNLTKLSHAFKFAWIVSICAWGEPTIYPHFNSVIDYILSENNKCRINMSTNGTCLTPAIANKLQNNIGVISISINAAKEDTYRRDMQGNLNDTLKSVDSFMAALPESSRAKVGFHFVAHADNYMEIPEFIILAKQHGVSQVCIGNYRANRESDLKRTLLSVNRNYDAIIEDATLIAKKVGVAFLADRFRDTKRVRPCGSMNYEIIIFNDGRVAPCCWCAFEHDTNSSMGNIYTSDFDSVWFGEKYKLLRNHPQPYCKNCVIMLPFSDPRVHIPERLWN